MQACITVNSTPQSQEARLAALVELQRLRMWAAQRRLRRAVSAEAELQAQAAPTVLADWTAWRRVAPGAPDLAPPPRPPPPPPRVPPPAAEVAALQTEMSRCGVQLDRVWAQSLYGKWLCFCELDLPPPQLLLPLLSMASRLSAGA